MEIQPHTIWYYSTICLGICRVEHCLHRGTYPTQIIQNPDHAKFKSSTYGTLNTYPFTLETDQEKKLIYIGGKWTLKLQIILNE